MTKVEMLTQAALLGRGWTLAGIHRFLGDPDATRPNPRYRSAAPSKLWELDRVEAAEASPEWAAWRLGSKARRSTGRATADRKRAEVAAMVETITINIIPTTLDVARSRAVRAYNEHADYIADRRGYSDPDREPASLDSDPDFLDRITVNYLRHERTSYDALGDRLFGLVGRAEAHELLRERVLGAIGATYPALAVECKHQARPRSVDRLGNDLPWEP